MQAYSSTWPVWAARPHHSRFGLFSVVALLVLALSFMPSVLTQRLGYTVSLLVFAIPACALGWTLMRLQVASASVRALRRAWLVLVPMGFVLNLAFADRFFLYPNRDAVIGVSLPAIDASGLDFAHPIPIEEFAFYAAGFLAMLLLYALADEWLFPTSRAPSRAAPYGFVEAMVTPCVLVGAIWNVKDAAAAPWYLSYLCAVPLPVTLLLLPKVRSVLNHKALATTLVVLLVTSFVWEAVLAVPRGWWGYQSGSMVGLALFGLPVEAVVVWVLAPVTTAVVYEFFRFHWRPQ
jgi:hypothetical protein